MWGDDAQIKMMQEECAECTLAITKFYNRGGTQEQYDNVIDEIADVTILSKQMEFIPGFKEKVQKRIDFKMNRLEQRLNNHKF